MKKTIATILLSASAMAAVQANAAADAVPGVSVDRMQMNQSGDFLTLDMLLGLKDLRVEANRAVLLTPVLVNGADSMKLPAVGVYGRTRYYQYLRSTGGDMISGPGETSFKSSSRPEAVEYSQVIPFREWMNGAELKLERSDYGCCHRKLSETEGFLGRHSGKWFPELVYVMPKGQAEKSRSIEGSAFIEFPVDQTVIDPSFRTNAAELDKIIASIDSVKSDKDATVTSVWLKGYASPDGKWDYNAGLAEGRTQAVKSYVERLYNFPAGVLSAASQPEDWAGLRKFVESSNLEHRAQILAVIDSDMEPDAKEWRIKSTYPEEYRFLLETVYPSLRHTDYRIAYNVRRYTSAADVRKVLNTRPQNLNLDELYLLAAEYEPGTPEFTEVYETAVRMFPGDPVANLNAANAAMRRGDLEQAERYIAKAGNSAEAVYARAAIQIRRKDYPAAIRLLREAQKMGLPQAAITLRQVEQIGGGPQKAE